jgi:hypothetical protein
MRAWKAGYARKMLFEKYRPLIWGKKQLNWKSFTTACYHHLTHNPPDVVIVKREGGKDTAGVAKMLTELYSRKVEGMKPEDVTGKDYYQANKLVIEEQKLSLDKNAQMLEFAKIFGIPENPIKLKEENAQLGPGEDEGDKPTDS